MRHQFEIVCSDSVSKWIFAFNIFILFSRGDVPQFFSTSNQNISSNDCYLKRQTSLFRCQRRSCANRIDDAHILGINLCGRYDNLETRKNDKTARKKATKKCAVKYGHREKRRKLKYSGRPTTGCRVPVQTQLLS